MFQLLFIHFIFAQNKHKKVIESDWPAYKHAVYLRPLNAANYSHPRLSIGYEMMLKDKRKFVSTTLSAFFNNFYETNRDIRFVSIELTPTSGLNVEAEYKWFKKKLFYYSVALCAGQIKYNANNVFNYIGSQGTENNALEYFNVTKKWLEPSARIGWRLRPNAKLFFDFFTGIGLRLKEIIHTSTTARNNATMEKTFNVFYFRDRPGTFLLPTIKAGLNVGFKF